MTILSLGTSCTYGCGCRWVRSTPTERDHHWTVVCDRHRDRYQVDTWTHDDGGRADAGYRGETGDCVARSIAIASGLPYQHVYDGLNQLALNERPRNGRKRSSARTGVHTPTIRRYLASIGFGWTAAMQIGSGCQVHLLADELPPGRLVVKCSKHVTAVIDGVIHDTHDPSRGGTRCVYGWWAKPPGTPGAEAPGSS